MPTIKYPKNPNVETAFVEQDDGTRNRAVLTAPQDISTIEYPNNPNSTKAYVTVNGKKQRVVMIADIAGGGGSSLPDQTGHSGEFLTTDGTDASWSDKPLVNDATQNTSIAIGAATTYNNVTLLGSGAVVGGVSCICIGRTTIAHEKSVAIGAGAEAKKNCITIGYASKIGSTAVYAIQLNASSSAATNSDSNTFKVANANGNFEIMSADGTVPTARLTKVNSTITLTAAGWSNSSQTVSVTGMTATGVVLVSPDPTDQADYTSAGIICSAQAAGTLTFTCSTTPANDIDVVVVML